MFHNIFDTVPERPVCNSDNLYFVLDGGSLIHRVVWPKQETFATDDADVHIVKTAIQTHEKIKKQVVVIGQDDDLLVFPTALTPDYMDILMLKEGKVTTNHRSCTSTLPSHIPPRAIMARTVFEPIHLEMEVVNKSLTPIYTTKGPAPSKIVSLITCGCNKGCGKKCKCVRTNLRFTTLCKNCQSCINTEAIDIVEEEDEEGNDII
ncbi:hypothetical protein AVEN_226268-1 [Araneus ventricosus]|uniref:Tesmin/TSO1-like CXC domain-containing protein n=1 Tax=Araneus ventricosus TaxID=182803 RepID=A0A4Y2DAL4_ARAVE|nr:hypothetical protein AVEN_226268-1 [Araneus ventricosus]